MQTEYISLAIAALGFLASVYYSNKNGQRQDTNERIEQAKETERIVTKLDGISADVRDTARAIDKLREEIAQHSDRITKVEQSVKSSHHRIDEIIKLHNRCCGVGQQYRAEGLE